MKTYSLTKKDKELIEKAKKMLKKVKLSGEKKVGEVGAVLITNKRNFYTGVCADLYCSLGGCAERGAILSMLNDGETQIDTIVAVSGNKILPPCGVCREMILQVNKKNLNTDVIISKTKKVKLNDLLPERWQDVTGDY